MGRSSAWGQLDFQPLSAPWTSALTLFRFAGAWAPPSEGIDSGWGVWEGERPCGALLAERAGTSAMLHGPVVVAPDGAPAEDAFEVAGELLTGALRHAEAQGVHTLYTRPQGQDRIWVRHGFIPVPEAELPKPLRGRPGAGLFGWRGGSALWSSAGRGTPSLRPPRRP